MCGCVYVLGDGDSQRGKEKRARGREDLYPDGNAEAREKSCHAGKEPSTMKAIHHWSLKATLAVKQTRLKSLPAS